MVPKYKSTDAQQKKKEVATPKTKTQHARTNKQYKFMSICTVLFRRYGDSQAARAKAEGHIDLEHARRIPRIWVKLGWENVVVSASRLPIKLQTYIYIY